MVANTKAVYTAIFGDRDRLWEPKSTEPGVDYICFTDRPDFESNIWDIRIEPIVFRSPVMAAKYFKLHPEVLRKENYEQTLWIDGRFELCSLRKSFEMMENNLALTMHSQRDCVYAEAEIVREKKQDRDLRIDRAVALCRKWNHPENYGLWRGGVIWRKDHPQVREFNKTWWQFIKETSVRDQLTLPLVLRLSGIEFQTFSRSFPNLIAHPHTRKR